MSVTTRFPRALDRALRRAVLLAPLGAALLAGCVDDTIAPHVPVSPQDATSLYWKLRNDHAAATLSTVAPYDTLRIRALPRDAMGRPLNLEGEITFTTSQPSRVQVSADGLVRAIAPGTNIVVVATLATGNLRHSDTTYVNVTTQVTPPTVGSFSAQPVPPDSARWTIHHDFLSFNPAYVKRLPLRIADANGKPITGLAVRYRSSDPVGVPINPTTGEIKSKRRGRYAFTAEATIYGKTWKDSVDFEFSWPVLAWIIPADRSGTAKGGSGIVLDPGSARIAQGGAVVFVPATEYPVGIVFDDPTHVEQTTGLGCVLFPDQGGRGDIAPFGGAPVNPFLNCRSRRFPVPGVYRFRTVPGDVRGEIHVEAAAP